MNENTELSESEQNIIREIEASNIHFLNAVDDKDSAISMATAQIAEKAKFSKPRIIFYDTNAVYPTLFSDSNGKTVFIDKKLKELLSVEELASLIAGEIAHSKNPYRDNVKHSGIGELINSNPKASAFLGGGLGAVVAGGIGNLHYESSVLDKIAKNPRWEAIEKEKTELSEKMKEAEGQGSPLWPFKKQIRELDNKQEALRTEQAGPLIGEKISRRRLFNILGPAALGFIAGAAVPSIFSHDSDQLTGLKFYDTLALRYYPKPGAFISALSKVKTLHSELRKSEIRCIYKYDENLSYIDERTQAIQALQEKGNYKGR